MPVALVSKQGLLRRCSSNTFSQVWKGENPLEAKTFKQFPISAASHLNQFECQPRTFNTGLTLAQSCKLERRGQILQQETYDLVPVMFEMGLGVKDALVSTDSFHFIMETYSAIAHH